VIDNAASDLRVLREKVDDNSVRVGSLTQELDALRQGIAGLSAPRALGEPDSVSPGPDAAASAANAVGGSPQKLLDGAQSDYWAGHYDLAILGFEQYIASFPQSPQVDYAQYYVGSSYFQAGKYQEAIAAYNALISKYPKSTFLPDAYVKMGTAHKTLKDNEKARQAFDFVIKNYPDSVAATIAQQSLSSLQPPARR
jgi:tol-pal system protein YbgF